MIKKLAVLLLAVGVLVPLTGCATKSVTRVDPSSVTDLSGRWNDTDSRVVANALIEQSLGSPWAIRYTQQNGGEMPTVIVGSFRNQSMEHIPVNTFIKDLERAFVNSGAVRVVASADERSELRGERDDQQDNARSDSRAQLRNEIGADYMLQGTIESIEDQEGREKVVFYQIDATLVDLESNAKIWVGQHKIKKLMERSRVGWE